MTTEENLLKNFLLSRASLQEFLTLDQFIELFPRAYRDHPHVALLYHESLHQRALKLDTVERNIEEETLRGEELRHEIIAAAEESTKRRRLRSGRSSKAGSGNRGIDDNDEATEVEMEDALFGPVSRSTKPHTLCSIVQSMEDACVDIEDEVASLDVQAAAILTDVRATIAALDGLHSGCKMKADSGIRSTAEGALMDLQILERICTGESK